MEKGLGSILANRKTIKFDKTLQVSTCCLFAITYKKALVIECFFAILETETNLCMK